MALSGLLIASPQLRDPNFHHTVVLLCHHDDMGALGLVLTREGAVRVDEVLARLEIDAGQPFPALTGWGGPVGDGGEASDAAAGGASGDGPAGGAGGFAFLRLETTAGAIRARSTWVLPQAVHSTSPAFASLSNPPLSWNQPSNSCPAWQRSL